MNQRVIIFGSTGMVGKGVLLECISSPLIGEVLLINREACGVSSPKVKEIIRPDFFDLPDLSPEFKGYDACFYCLGVSFAGISESNYRKVTFDLTLYIAGLLIKANEGLTFCYVSGAGTDNSGKNRWMWTRIKGETENALLAMPFKKVFMFRPGFIQPMKGVKSKTPMYNLFYSLLKHFYFFLKFFSSFVTNSQSVGQAMIKIACYGYTNRIIENTDINEVAKKQFPA